MKNTPPKENPTASGLNPMILLCLLLSGACGLIYEILWMKMLTLTMGNTVFSITTVLTAFMGGLALGSFLAGRAIEKIKNPLNTYALLEGGIGLYALLLPWLIAGTEPLFRVVYQNFDPSWYAFGLLRFFVCGLLLLAPTILMGATLPVLSQYFAAGCARLGRTVGLLYGVNTLGAVLGCALAGFILIPALGVTWTIYGAALLNLAICAGLLKLAKNPVERVAISSNNEKNEEKKHKKQKKQPQRQPLKSQKGAEGINLEFPPSVVWVVMAGIGLSGLAAMIYQIAWTRVIALSIGSSVYAFSLIVTAFIGGLAIGSLVIAGFVDRRKNLLLGLSLLQGLIGIAALVLIPLLGMLPVFIAKSVFAASHSFRYIQLVEFAVIFVLLLFPTLMMGAAVPMAVKICTPDARRVARFFGNVYAANTLGAIAGSVIAGFCLIPWLGTRNSLLVAVGLNILAAIIILLHSPNITAHRRIAGALATFVIAVSVWFLLPQWEPAILTSAPYLYADRYRSTSAKKGIDFGSAMKAGQQLLFFKEGLHALISVNRTDYGDVLLGVNGKTDASAKGGDVATQLMVGHLPLLLHPGARDVLVIGLGSGMTLGAVERHPVKAVDVVEIEPAVVEASQYFLEFTGEVLNDPRVNLIVADGRNHLALTNRRYDVIISEPSNPWVAGMANLFTREFLELARQRLRPQGLMCQWVHAYSMSSDDFKSIVHTFQTVFPNAMVWEASFGNDYLLIGFPQDWRIDPRLCMDRLDDQRLKAHLERMHIRAPAAFINKLIITREAIAAYVKGTPLHTDGNALIEYSAPKALFQGRSPRLLAELYRCRSQPADMLKSLQWLELSPLVINDLTAMIQAKQEIVGAFIENISKGTTKAVFEHLENALNIYPGDFDGTHMFATAYYDLGSALEDAQRPAEAISAYKKSIAAIENFIGRNREASAVDFRLDVIYAKANLQLGTLALKADRLDQAASALEKSLSGEVRDAHAHNNLGIVYERRGRYDAAVEQFRRAIDLEPDLVSAHMNMGNTLLKQKKYSQAIATYHRIKELQPDFALTNYNLGMAFFMSNQWKAAEAEWERALALKPDFDQARQGLKVLRQKMQKQ